MGNLAEIIIGKGYIIVTDTSIQKTVRQDFLSFSGDDIEKNKMYQAALTPEFVIPMPERRVFICSNIENRNDAEVKAAEYAMAMVQDNFGIEIESIKIDGEPSQTYNNLKIELHFTSLSQNPSESSAALKTQGQKLFGNTNFIFEYTAIVDTLFKSLDE